MSSRHLVDPELLPLLDFTLDDGRHLRPPAGTGSGLCKTPGARAGVPLEVKVYPGAPHAFSRIADAVVTEAYQRDLAEALAAAFRRPPTTLAEQRPVN